MPAFRNMMHWFNEAGRRDYRGPVHAALVLDDGSLVHIDYSNYADRQKASPCFDRYVGHVTLVPKPGKWAFDAKSPVDPMHTLTSQAEYDSAKEAAAAMVAKVAGVKAAEEAVRADPAAWLDRELSHHDWFAAYSDAPGVCGAADMHWRDTILPLKARVAPEVWAALFEKHAPVECKGMGAS